jgi:hypothetical protein
VGGSFGDELGRQVDLIREREREREREVVLQARYKSRSGREHVFNAFSRQQLS